MRATLSRVARLVASGALHAPVSLAPSGDARQGRLPQSSMIVIQRPAARRILARAATLAGLVAAACTTPLKLARDDSATVLAHQSLTAADPSARGTYAVRTLYYGSGTDRRRSEYRDSVTLKTATVDASKFAAAPTPEQKGVRRRYWGFEFSKAPINGRVWYPDGAGPFPLVLIVHGNHGMKNFSDPGYAYLGELLASRGFILASVDENFLNGFMRNENDARGWMLLKHLQAWRGFNDSASSPLRGKVDMHNIALMGHSRGGEAVAVAGAFNRLARYPDDATIKFDFNFDIKSIVAIAPVDGQYKPTDRGTPLVDYNYLVMHGSHDGDVSGYMGLAQYERVRFTDDRPSFKSAVFVYRANHGQWNTEWGSLDGGPQSARALDIRGLMPAEEQRQFAKVYISAFLEATLRGRTEYLPMFRDHRVAGGWLPKTMYITRFQESAFRALATYDDDVDVTTGSVPGVSFAGDSLGSWKELPVPLRSRSTSQGHNAVLVGWNTRLAGSDTTKMGTPAAYAMTFSDSLVTAWRVDSSASLVFSLAPTIGAPGPRAVPRDSSARTDSTARTAVRPPRKMPEDAGPDTVPMDLSIVAVDANGRRASVPLSAYGAIRRPLESYVYRRAGRDKSRFPTVYEIVLQTFTVPLADFTRVTPEFDASRLRTVSWRFDRTVKGTVWIDNIGFSKIRREFEVPVGGAR